VAYFIKPVLERHDRDRVEVFCYSDVEAEDELTTRLRGLADAWRRTASLTNDELEERIRADRIDILVDLAGHTTGGLRLPLFARKPAPVQVTWLGYLNTTGLAAMDYRISDARACPGWMDAYHSERVVRLPHSQWCYDPLGSWPEVGPLPAGAGGAITFGSFNNLPKVVPEVLALWGRLLREVPESRLIMVGAGLNQIGARFAERLAAGGADPTRVQFFDRLPLNRYFGLHNSIDINLDSFPFTGGTTTFHSLWMGVPIVTLAGRHVASRGGASILHVLGLQELVADSEQRYVEIAVSLAADRPRLAKLRASLRERLRRSELMDAARYTSALESAYREMWRNWCAGDPATPAQSIQSS
jgi:predicted O-linked N-acetylglucosamine transferase (SPINDLY family)